MEDNQIVRLCKDKNELALEELDECLPDGNDVAESFQL